jgi:hypothetical protein
MPSPAHAPYCFSGPQPDYRQADYIVGALSLRRTLGADHDLRHAQRHPRGHRTLQETSACDGWHMSVYD